MILRDGRLAAERDREMRDGAESEVEVPRRKAA
jgi:hypothetical protein